MYVQYGKLIASLYICAPPIINILEIFDEISEEVFERFDIASSKDE